MVVVSQWRGIANWQLYVHSSRPVLLWQTDSWSTGNFGLKLILCVTLKHKPSGEVSNKMTRSHQETTKSAQVHLRRNYLTTAGFMLSRFLHWFCLGQQTDMQSLAVNWRWGRWFLEKKSWLLSRIPRSNTVALAWIFDNLSLLLNLLQPPQNTVLLRFENSSFSQPLQYFLPAVKMRLQWCTMIVTIMCSSLTFLFLKACLARYPLHAAWNIEMFLLVCTSRCSSSLDKVPALKNTCRRRERVK